MMASLDHTIWFHAPFRADEWLLYDMEVVKNYNLFSCHSQNISITQSLIKSFLIDDNISLFFILFVFYFCLFLHNLYTFILCRSFPLGFN